MRPHSSLLALAALLAVIAGPWTGQADENRVLFEGLQTIEEEEARKWLKSQITFVNSAGVSMARADDLAYFLETALRERGYKQSQVEWSLVGEGAQARIRLLVSEGISSRVTSFEISGNETLEDEAVVELLSEATRSRLRLKADSDLPFVPTDLDLGLRKLEQFYALLGFNDAEVVLDTATESSGTRVLVRIKEGRQQAVTSVRLPDPMSDTMAEQFEEIEEEFNGKKFNPALLSTLKSRLRSIAVNAGYYEATVTVESHSATAGTESEGDTPVADFDGVQLVASLDWGKPVAVTGVSVNGNQRVSSEFFERHFGELVGQPYSPAETSEAVNELLTTGAFETIRTDPVKQEDGSFQLEVDVSEGYTRTLGIFGGFTNYEGPIGGFEFRNLNLFGSVRTLDAEIEFSRRGARGAINYEDPWFLDSEVEFAGGLFAAAREEEGYDKWETGGNYQFTRKFGEGDRTSLSLFGQASYTEIDDAEIAARFLGNRDYFLHYIGLALSHDRRDDPLRPTKGFIAQGSASVSSSGIGSEVDFFKATGRIGYYHPVGRHRFRMAARAGSIAPIGDTAAIPIDLRFFNGGPQTVRSFQERALGPLDPTSGHPIGGEFYTIFNVEYEIPIEVLDGLSLVVFGDAGNVLVDADDASLDNMRYAIGAGLRYLTPIGPLRFEYGYNPDQRIGEPEGTFHVGFGFSY